METVSLPKLFPKFPHQNFPGFFRQNFRQIDAFAEDFTGNFPPNLFTANGPIYSVGAQVN